MRVRCLTCLSGRDFAYAPGDEAEFDDAEAARFLAAGYVERIGPAPAGEPADARSAAPQPQAAVDPAPAAAAKGKRKK